MDAIDHAIDALQWALLRKRLVADWCILCSVFDCSDHRVTMTDGKA